MLLLIIFVAVTVVCALILHHGPWDVDTDLPGVALGMVLKRQANNDSIWLRAYTHDFWDDMPLIELEEE